MVDTLGIEPMASRMLSRCGTTTPCAPYNVARAGAEGEIAMRTRMFLLVCGNMQFASDACAFKRPHRLVARASRCGGDNPGSIPGVRN